MKTYFINSNRRSRLPIAVSFEEQMPKYQVAHRHDGYEIMFISSGYGWCAVNGVRMPLLAGDLFFMGMEDEHEFLLRAPGSYYNIMFRPELIPESDQESLRQAPFFRHFGKPEFTFQRKAVFPLRISGYLVEQFRQMYQESLNSHFALPLQLRSRLYHILVKIGEYSMLFGEARTTDRGGHCGWAGRQSHLESLPGALVAGWSGETDPLFPGVPGEDLSPADGDQLHGISRVRPHRESTHPAGVSRLVTG
ncbi:MAG: AraC family ligand binding domain-containing protein [Lentisphaeria bacterium]|nr:MAG: AraC family ligand binding domain-containing protein [Lentisphaeria bacterium]